ncbi:MAG: hypothetical protein L6V93_21745 [Clostridiales bacterium]|nr:MAG: hypothetical protein L6V93_21745 [Clostridiales bacterium]
MTKFTMNTSPKKSFWDFPKNMDGSVGFRGEITLEFKKRWRKDIKKQRGCFV